jgi:hypothetical protein
LPAGPARGDRVQRIRRPRRDELVARCDQRLRRGSEELGDARAGDDALGLGVERLPELGAQRRGSGAGRAGRRT